MATFHAIYLTSPLDIQKNVVVASGSVSIAFTDGDTVRRSTVTDTNVFTTSNIIGMIRRPDSDNDTADSGYIYVYNVVKISNGSFDILVSCLDWGFEDPYQDPPDETIKFNYFVLNTV